MKSFRDLKLSQLKHYKKVFSILIHTYRYWKRAEKNPDQISELKRKWAHGVLDRLNVELEIKGEISKDSPVIFVGNHIGYVDIPLVMALVDDVSFLAKKEVEKMPIIGPAARFVGTVFVDRENQNARVEAREKIIKELKEFKKRILIFPSGTTSLDEEKPWKKGAFKIAEQGAIKIQPFRIRYEPLRTVAYIDDDFMPVHIIGIFDLKEKVKASIEFGPVGEVLSEEDLHSTLKWVRGS